MGQMSVLYSFPVRIGRAGIGTVAWQQVNSLIAQGIRVHLSCGSCEKPIAGLGSLVQTLMRGGVRLPIRLLGVDYAVGLHDRLTARHLLLLADKDGINIVHCWPVGAEKTLETARFLGIKTVIERPNTHTGHAYRVVEKECRRLGVRLGRGHNHKVRPRRLRREEREYDLADLILCPSRQVRDTFIEAGFAEEKLAIHQYGFDPEIFTAPRDDARAQSDIFRMAFVGSGEPRKGLHYALDAWLGSDACKTGVFYICGSILGGYRRLLAPKLAHQSIKELGRINNVSQIMQESHALVLPSIEEGSALVTYEARACGCVLLVSAAAGAVCEHNNNALVHKPGDVAALRGHIDMLASDRALFRTLQANSLAGLGELTWESAGRVLAGIYKRLLNGNLDVNRKDAVKKLVG
jgi:glycosyltransferase involved in cell wall biosynthesis